MNTQTTHSLTNNKNAELHVVFGSGVLGKNAARELHRLGKQVRIVNRSGKAQHLPAEIEIVSANANDVSQVRQLTQNAAVVYQCAQPHYHEWAEKFPALQASIMQGTMDNGAKLVVADNLYMYGDTNGTPIREDMPYLAHTKKGKVRAKMAQSVMGAHESGKIRACIARASDFFGPEDSTNTPMWFGAALAGKAVNVLGRTDVQHTFSYAPDFGRALALLGTRSESWGQIWHVPSNPALSQAEFVQLISEAIAKPVKLRSAGKWLLQLLGLFNPTLRELPEMLYEWEKPFVMDDSKFRRVFGMQPTPLRQAIAETLVWIKVN